MLSSIELLSALIATPSISRDESAAADLLQSEMLSRGLQPERLGNNLWTCSSDFDNHRPTVLLNAHIDTVKPVPGWQHDPFTPSREGDRLYGLGANDCGGGLVSLLEVFCRLRETKLPFNLIYLASAEEEVSGQHGIVEVIPLLPSIQVAVVGEPTAMQPAIAERGLMVIDCTSHGKSGHAARNEGINAIYLAMQDILTLQQHQFSRVSPLLGPVKATATIIQAGTQHNVIPDTCTFTLDVRVNECYTNQEILQEITGLLRSEVHARSTRLASSHINPNHPFIEWLQLQGKKPFGSPTLSDQALMPWLSFKLGPGHSSRSHTADEYICISEIEEAITLYTQMLTQCTQV